MRIRIFADWHIGDKHCNMKLIQEMIKEVLEEEHTYCIIVGDLINNSTTSSIGDTYEETLSPMEQVKTIAELLKPIKHKILAISSGNHCYRSYKTEGVDLLYFMCAELGIADKYDPIGALLFIRFGADSGLKETKTGEPRKICYTLYMTHGSASGRTVGAKANALNRLGDVINADICVIAHTHLPMVFRESSFVIDYPNSSYHQKETVYVNSASTLEWGGYAEKLSLKPSSTQSPIIRLDGRKFNINVTL